MRDGCPDDTGVEPFGVPEGIGDRSSDAEQPHPLDLLESAAVETGATRVNGLFGLLVERRTGHHGLRCRHRIEQRLAPQGQEERVAATVGGDCVEDLAIDLAGG